MKLSQESTPSNPLEAHTEMQACTHTIRDANVSDKHMHTVCFVGCWSVDELEKKSEGGICWGMTWVD